MKNTPIWKLLLLLLPLVTGMPFAMDMYVPALPVMKEYFETSVAMMQWTLSVFVFFTGAGQLIVGPISDAIGRKKVVVFSLCIFTIGEILCFFSQNITFFLVARAIGALGACGMTATAFAIARDLYSGKMLGKIFSYLYGTIALSPLLAPFIGSYLITWFTWRSIFLFLILLGAYGTLANWRFLSETHHEENRHPVNRSIFHRYLQLALDPTFICFSLCSAFGLAAIFLFFSQSPYLIIDNLGYSAQQFGYIFGLNGLASLGGNIVTGWCIQHLGINKTAFLGTVLLLLAGLSMIFWYAICGLTIYSLVVPSMLAWFAVAMMMISGGAGGIHPFPKMAGMATALQGSFNMIFASFVGSYVNRSVIQDNLTLAISFACLGLVPLLSLLFVKLYMRKI